MMVKSVIFVLCFCICSAKITIKKLDVPPSISVQENHVVLDCDFDSQGEPIEEIKWTLNNESRLIYQWLPQVNQKPQVRDSLKDNIDVTYKVTNDKNTMYRAIHIINLSPELSGDYTCKVSGDVSEDVKTKRMIVYEPADSDLELDVKEDYSETNSTEDELVAVTCTAEGLYPEPDMKISVSNDNETEIAPAQKNFYSETDDGLYNVSLINLYDPDDLQKSFYYTCELTIPETDYTLSETKQYTLESDYETRIESDYETRNESEEESSMFLNSTTSTELSDEESKDIETQIEENKVYTLKISTADAPPSFKDDDGTLKKEDRQVLQESGTSKRSANLFSSVLLVTLLGTLYL